MTNPIYALNAKGDEVYSATAPVGNVYAKSASGYQYARLRDGTQVYFKHNGASLLITDNAGNQLYAKTKDGSEYYPKDANGVDFAVVNINGTIRYAKSKDGVEQYPKDASGAEFMVGGVKATDTNGNVLYLRDANGRPLYPVNPISKDEIYEQQNAFRTGIVFGVDADGNERYAKKANGDEYYPDTNQFAFNKQWNMYTYARKMNGDIIFKLNRAGDELYIQKPDKSDEIYVEPGVEIPRYARLSNRQEYYPKGALKSDSSYVECVLQDRYAVDEKGNSIYPQDEFGNEFVLQHLTNTMKMYAAGYPTTHDSFIIVTKQNNGPLLWPRAKLSKRSIIGYLDRSWGQVDYITDVKGMSNQRRNFKKPYKIRLLNQPKNTAVANNSKGGWTIYIAMIFVLALLVLVWFGLRN